MGASDGTRSIRCLNEQRRKSWRRVRSQLAQPKVVASLLQPETSKYSEATLFVHIRQKRLSGSQLVLGCTYEALDRAGYRVTERW